MLIKEKMSRAEICPVCYGKGVVYGVAETGAYPTTPHAYLFYCEDERWVIVGDSYISPYYPSTTNMGFNQS